MFKRQGGLGRQRGVTFIGWVFLLIPIAIVGYAGIRLVPIYLNYMRVVRSLEMTAQETKTDDAASVTVAQIRNTLSKHFDIENIDFPDVNDVTIQREGTDWVLEAKFQDTAPLFYNISLLLDFDKTARVGG